jgi:hypothetical protein
MPVLEKPTGGKDHRVIGVRHHADLISLLGSALDVHTLLRSFQHRPASAGEPHLLLPLIISDFEPTSSRLSSATIPYLLWNCLH